MAELFLCTTFARDGVEYDVTISFTAHCTLPASRACWDDPGYAAEYETTFISAELDCPEHPEDRLTEAELATLRTWFVKNWDKASDAANDNQVGLA